MSGESFCSNLDSQEAMDSVSREVTYENKLNDDSISAITIESLKRQRAKSEIFVRSIKSPLAVFSGDSSLIYKSSETAKTFSFEATKGVVNVPEAWFDGKYEDGELRFAAHHELAHFMDMRKNPDAYLKIFDESEQDAKGMADKYLREHPDCKNDIDSVKDYFCKELHLFNNIMDDIYVNSVVKSKAPMFAQKEGQKSIKSLYKKLGFGSGDISHSYNQEGEQVGDTPLHRQMMYALMHEVMLAKKPGLYEGITVSPEVAEVLQKKDYQMTVFDTIQKNIVAKYGILIDPAERQRVLKTRIKPHYIDLLWKGIAQQDQKKQDQQTQEQQNQQAEERDSEQQQSQSGELSQQQEQSEGNFNPFNDDKEDNNNGDQLFSDDIEEKKQLAKTLSEEKHLKEMTPEERAEHNNKKQQEEYDEKHGISEQERETYEHAKDKINDARKEMRAFWRNLIGKSMAYNRKYHNEQIKGGIDVASLIKHFPDYEDGIRNGDIKNLPIYGRYEYEKQLVDKPERIDISLLVDASGSMNGRRSESAREAATLLALSIKDFNSQLDNERRVTHSNLRARSEVYAFGSEFEKIKSFEKQDKAIDVSEVEIIKMASKINANLGSTDESLVYNSILKELSNEDKQKIKEGKLKKIIFEITDGSPDDAEELKEKLKPLRDAGVIIYAFQITDDLDNIEIFDEIWNNKQGQQCGVHIGNKIENLPKELIKVAGNLLEGIRI